MESIQQQDQMRKAAERFSECVARKDVDAILSCFSEDCVIEFLNVKLKGKHGVREWLKWLYSHMSELKFEDNATVTEGYMLFKESMLVGKLHNGIKMRSKQAHIVVFDSDYMIRNFRYYFDRLDFVESGINRIMAKSLRQTFDQRTLKHLAKYTRE